MKNSIKLLTVLIMIIFLTSCSSGTMLNKRLIVQNTGVDRSSNGVSLSVNAYSSGQKESSYINKEGQTVADAMENISTVTGQPPFFSHNQTIVIGKQSAQKGLNDILDFFMQYFECSPSVDIFISEQESSELLSLTSEDTLLSYKDLYTLSNRGVTSGQYVSMELYSLGDILNQEVKDFCLPILSCVSYDPNDQTKKRVELTGTALFRKGFYIDDLSKKETTAFLILTNNLNKAGLSFKLQDSTNITVALANNCTNITCTIDNGVHFNIDVTLDCSLIENTVKNGKEVDETFITEIKNEAKEEMEKSIKSVINKCFNYRCDPFGFYKILKNNYNDYWENIKDNYQTQIASWKYDVKVQIK